MNKVRSIRDLEKECRRNIEVMWLLKCLKPDHNTIANFRKDNPKAIKKVFRTTVQITRHFDPRSAKGVSQDTCFDVFEQNTSLQVKKKPFQDNFFPDISLDRKFSGSLVSAYIK